MILFNFESVSTELILFVHHKYSGRWAEQPLIVLILEIKKYDALGSSFGAGHRADK